MPDLAGTDLLAYVLERCDVDPMTGCWMWRLKKLPKGYGQLRLGSAKNGTRRMVLVHRATFEAKHGPIPAGLQLDHVECNRPSCAHPDHTAPRTPAQNNARSASPTAVNARKTECEHCGAALRPKKNRPSQRECMAGCYVRRYRERKAAVRG